MTLAEPTSAAELLKRYAGARARLGLTTPAPRVARPAAALPDTSAPYTRPLERERPKKGPIALPVVVGMVSQETGVPVELIVNPHFNYLLVQGARHFVWCLLFDGGWSYAEIGRKFGVTTVDVKVAVLRYRAYQADKAVFE